MKKIMISIICLLFTVACQHDEPVIIKKDEQMDAYEEEMNEDNSEESNEQFFEISLPGENVQLNVEMIPILEEYLNLVNDKAKAIQQMNLIPLHATERTIYLLEFACQNNLCSYLIIDEDETHSSLLIADLAKYDYGLFSPDESLLAIKFDRDDSFSLPLGHLVVMDLEQWNTIPLTNGSDETNSLHFQTPILSVTWIDDTTISMQIPTIAELTEENISTWESSEGLTTDIIFQIEK